MLSLLYRLVEKYHRAHGLHPNRVYLNLRDYQKLLQCLPALGDADRIARFLMMRIVVSPETEQPYVAWMPQEHVPESMHTPPPQRH